MLSIYNILKHLIIESEPETGQTRKISAPISDDDIINGIKSFYMYRIRYNDNNGNPEPADRNVQFYVLGKLNGKKGTKAIRAFQNGGYTTSKNSIWKTFDISKISSIEPTKMHMGYLPVTTGSNLVQYQQYNDKSFATIIYQKRFDNLPDVSNVRRKNSEKPKLTINRSKLMKPLRDKEKENNKRPTNYNDSGRETNY